MIYWFESNPAHKIIKKNKMEIGTKYKFWNNTIGTLIQTNKNFGLFKFEDGSQFVFNLNKLM